MVCLFRTLQRGDNEGPFKPLSDKFRATENSCRTREIASCGAGNKRIKLNAMYTYHTEKIKEKTPFYTFL